MQERERRAEPRAPSDTGCAPRERGEGGGGGEWLQRIFEGDTGESEAGGSASERERERERRVEGGGLGKASGGEARPALSERGARASPVRDSTPPAARSTRYARRPRFAAVRLRCAPWALSVAADPRASAITRRSCTAVADETGSFCQDHIHDESSFQY